MTAIYYANYPAPVGSFGPQAAQSDWAIDPLYGSDVAIGTSSAPLRTLSEWVRRMEAAGKITASTMTVTILRDLAAGDYPVGTINVGNCYLTIRGAKTTVTTGTFTSVVSCDPATNVPYSITDTALPTNSFWSAHVHQSDALGRYIRITSGVHVDQVMWPAKDLGTKQVRVSTPIMIDPDQALFAYGIGALSVSDPYALEQLPFTHGMSVRFVTDINEGVSNGAVAAGRARVVFQDLAFPGLDLTTFTNVGVISSHGLWDFGGSLSFHGCDLGTQQVQGSALFVSCRYNYCQQVDGQRYVFGGLTAGLYGGFGIYSGNLNIDFRHLIQGDGTNTTGLFFGGGSYHQVGSVGAFDCYVGVSVSGSGFADFVPFITALELFGSGNATYGIRVDNGCTARVYSTGTKTLTGTLGDVRVGTATKTWGQIPFIDNDIAGSAGTKFTACLLY